MSYTASGGYVAFSTDAPILEEFIRSAQSPVRSLRETPGFADAADRVGGLGTGIFAYENQAESMRWAVELMKKTPTASPGSSSDTHPFIDALPFAGPEKSFRAWMDFSRLPEFEKVSKYFHFTVRAGSANAQGISFKFFSPTPTGAKP